jgi:hypothetical protein
MSTQNIFDLTDLWNAAGTTFVAIRMNATDTASAAGSLLMDLQVGGTSRFSVNKNGRVVSQEQIFGTRFYNTLNATQGFVFDSGLTYADSASGLVIRETGAFAGVTLSVDTSDTLAQRNGTNAQTFRLYNTFTDGSNHERGFMRWATNVLQIGTEKAGTGTARALELQTDGTTRLTIATNGEVTLTAPLILGLSGILRTRYINNADNAVTFWDFDAGAGGAATFGVGATTPLMRFGNNTSSFPALKRSTTSLQVRLADDSAFTNIQGKITTETAYTAGAPTATGYLVLYDSNGTAYKIPAEAL